MALTTFGDEHNDTVRAFLRCLHRWAELERGKFPSGEIALAEDRDAGTTWVVVAGEPVYRVVTSRGVTAAGPVYGAGE